jgi:hypothetical protein
MPSAQEKPIVRVAPNNPVVDLPALFTRAYDWMKARGSPRAVATMPRSSALPIDEG